MKDEQNKLAGIVNNRNIGQYQRHIIFCGGSKCGGSTEKGDAAWEYLKTRLKELHLSDGTVYRTRATCLRVCMEGPIAVVYPEGTWYKNLNLENIEKVIQLHLIKGRPVAELAFAENPLMLDM